MGDTLKILTSMLIYMAAVIVIGIAFARRANKNSDAYFLGGRTLGPWVTAMSAEASDMSGWLLMGLPGVAYWCGIADAAWTAIGLAVGLATAFVCTRFIQGALFGTAALDTVSFVTAPLVLGVVATVASLRPAWRAASIPPAECLRTD